MIRGAVVSLLLVLISVLAGCVGVTAQEKSKEELVAERAEARWSLLIKGDLSGAYAYLSPAKRSIESQEVYKGGLNPGMWRDAKVMSVHCPGEDLCNVKVSLVYQPPKKYFDGALMDKVLSEVWRRVDGEWWFVSQ